MNARRWKELIAISMIGEGMLATFFPDEHLSLWHVGPGPLKTAVRFCEQRPNLTRLLAVIEAGFGFALAYRQFDQRIAQANRISKVLGKLRSDCARSG
jgi:hypothetical protein